MVCNVFNVTKNISSDVVDITPMVFIVLFIFVILFLSFSILESVDGSKKIGKIMSFVAYVLVIFALMLNFLLIKVSVDAGIEWCKNQYGITEVEVQKYE